MKQSHRDVQALEYSCTAQTIAHMTWSSRCCDCLFALNYIFLCDCMKNFAASFVHRQKELFRAAMSRKITFETCWERSSENVVFFCNYWLIIEQFKFGIYVKVTLTVDTLTSSACKSSWLKLWFFSSLSAFWQQHIQGRNPAGRFRRPAGWRDTEPKAACSFLDLPPDFLLLSVFFCTIHTFSLFFKTLNSCSLERLFGWTEEGKETKTPGVMGFVTYGFVYLYSA